MKSLAGCRTDDMAHKLPGFMQAKQARLQVRIQGTRDIMETGSKTKLSPYQWRLLFFLSVATFFEGYDFIALTQVLPSIRAEMGLDPSDAGYLIGFINAGTVLAYLLVRQADRWGRKRVLLLTILGYTLFTFLTGFAPNVWILAGCQFLARTMLIAEWAISMVYAAEEFPSEMRATIIGVIQAFSSLGSIVCAGVVPFLLHTTYGWRTVYFIGVVPLILVAFARRNLRETSRFESLARSRELNQPEKAKPLTAIFHTPYRKRLLLLALTWGLTYVCTQNAITFWKEFAISERGFSDGDVGLSITIAAVVSMPLVFAAGKLLDVIGRRRGAAIIFLTTSVATVGAYTLHGQWMLTGALILAIFGASAVLPVLNAYTTELFPTELRGDAFAWSNNLLGRIGYVLSPIVVGAAADQVGWGPAVSITAIFPVLALIVILVGLPETRGKTLEETAAL
jgi:putative MFS transporter